jgi:hypothetical protein
MANTPQVGSRLLSAVVEYALLALLMIAVPLIIAVDVMVLDHGVLEVSLTEFTQLGLLFLSMLLTGAIARQHSKSRGFWVLVAGLLCTMLIRENDLFLDNIMHGFWFYPASLVAIVAIVFSIRLRNTIITPMLDFAATRACAHLVTGLLMVLLFSRVFGSGQLLSEVFGADYNMIYKSVIQEGLELLGYSLIFFGAVLAYRHRLRSNGAEPSNASPG